MGDRLRTVWDFKDLDVTEKRFRTLLELETSPSGRSEVLTQLARIQGLRGDVAEGDRLIDDAERDAGPHAAAQARIHLERGRLRRSGGDDGAALELFERAFETALTAGEEFLAVDAAHMAALVAPDRAGRLAWSQRGISLAQGSTDRQVSYWLGPLLNNLGWEYYSTGDHRSALDAFERALQARERDREHPADVAVARYAVGKTLRAMGEAGGAAAMLEQAVAWTETVGEPDGWFHEELAEDYAALDRDAEAAEQARLAVPLLLAADPSFAGDVERSTRLRHLAGRPAAPS